MHYWRWKKYGDVRGPQWALDPAGFAAPDLAYAAGLLDGEGWFSIARKRGKSRNMKYVPIVGVSMCDPGALEFMVELFGSRLYLKKRKPDENWRDVWKWEIESQRAVDVARMTLPYLRVKRAQALALLALYDERDWSIGRRDILPPAEEERRMALKELMHELNRRGRRGD